MILPLTGEQESTLLSLDIVFCPKKETQSQNFKAVSVSFVSRKSSEKGVKSICHFIFSNNIEMKQDMCEIKKGLTSLVPFYTFQFMFLV